MVRIKITFEKPFKGGKSIAKKDLVLDKEGRPQMTKVIFKKNFVR